MLFLVESFGKNNLLKNSFHFLLHLKLSNIFLAKVSEDKYTKNLRWQRSANKEIWEALLRNGLTSEMEVRVDFSYYSPTKEKANALKLLLEEYEYEVSVNQFSHRKWLVEGRTNETTLSLEKLDERVLWMIAAGKEHDSKFDGWGTEIPNQARNVPEQMQLF